jgi:hypothetical protein
MRRPGGRAHRLALNRPSMIERAFLLRCLGNNVPEHVPKGKDDDKTLGQQFIAKRCYEHHTSFPN